MSDTHYFFVRLNFVVDLSSLFPILFVKDVLFDYENR